jgi:putative ABC transport system permease protein
MGMETIARFLRRIRYGVFSNRRADDLAAELEAHRAAVQARLESDGVPGDEAGVRSRRAMGNMTLAREDARDVWIGPALQRMWRDAMYGLRGLRRESTFALTALLALTIGITSTTTAFSVVDAELWKPLPFPDADRLVAVRARKSGKYEDLNGRDLQEWRARSRTARYVAATPSSRRVLQADRSESVTVRGITDDFLDVFGVPPSIGRGLTSGERDAALLTETGWAKLFNRDPRVLGRAILLDARPFTVVGITAGTRFEFIAEPDFFIALDPARDLGTLDKPSRLQDVYARMHDGIRIGEAQAELRALESTEATPDPAGARVLTLVDLQEDSTGFNWRELYFFFGAAGVLLLLSGLNVAGLLLSRALRRQREFAIRGALGGDVPALVRQLVAEGAVLAVPASAAGLLAATWLLRVLTVHVPPGHLERGGHIELDWRAAGFVLGVCGVTTILLALTPMLFARRIDLNVTLGQGDRSAGPSRRDRRIRNTLLTAQVTVTVVLLSAAALFTASFRRVISAPLGFEPDGRLAVRLALSGSRYSSDSAIVAFADRLVEDAAGHGLGAVAIGSSSPLDNRGGPAMNLALPGRTRPERGKEPSAVVRAIGPSFFRTLGIRLSAGRDFNASDVSGAPRVAIVNELLVRRLFPGEQAVGRELEITPRFRTGWTNRPGTVVIVGVVGDVRNFGINEVEFNNIYLPFAQAPSPGFEVIARSQAPAADVIASMRSVIARVDPSLPIANAATLNDRVEEAIRGDRFNMTIVLLFAAAATLLAAVGIYGGMACSIQERTREFGIRTALGARPMAVLRTAIVGAMRIAMAGAISGLLVAFAVARLLGNALYLVPGEHGGLLYGVRSTNPLILGSAALLVIGVALAAGFIPARHAARIDPLIALRSE